MKNFLRRYPSSHAISTATADGPHVYVVFFSERVARKCVMLLFLAAATAGSDGGSPGEVPPSGISSYAYSSVGGSSSYGAEYADLLAKFDYHHTPIDVGQCKYLCNSYENIPGRAQAAEDAFIDRVSRG